MASDGARKQFWKRSNSKVPGSIQHVYGAQHPPFDPLLHGTLLKSTPKVPTTPVKAKRVSTFQEFESNTSDAWDAGEDDDELLAMATESLNSEVVMETAHRVLRNHSQRQSQPSQKTTEPDPEPQPIAEPPVPPSGDLRLVKSVSESHTPCPSESTGDTVPLQRSQSLPHSATVTLSGTSDPHALADSALSKRETSRLDKFKQLLAGPNTDLEELRKLSWSGIPKPVRPMTWKLLSGYLPANVDRRPATLQRKQKEYFAFIEHYYSSRNDEVHQDTYRQIHIDIPRMSPEALILQPKVTEIFERILFIWAIRHPASGYVQGINDLVTPFFVVFICEYTGRHTP